MNREEVVVAGITVVGHVDRETDIVSIISTGPGNVSRITVDAESGDFGGGEKDA